MCDRNLNTVTIICCLYRHISRKLSLGWKAGVATSWASPPNWDTGIVSHGLTRCATHWPPLWSYLFNEMNRLHNFHRAPSFCLVLVWLPYELPALGVLHFNVRWGSFSPVQPSWITSSEVVLPADLVVSHPSCGLPPSSSVGILLPSFPLNSKSALRHLLFQTKDDALCAGDETAQKESIVLSESVFRLWGAC